MEWIKSDPPYRLGNTLTHAFKEGKYVEENKEEEKKQEAPM
jgi:hypothetical protein